MEKDLKVDNENREVKQKVKKTKDNKKIIQIIIVIAIILTIILIAYFGYKIYYSAKYSKYEEKMNKFGFNNLYMNGSAKSTEKVKKSELIGVIIGSMIDVTNIDELSTPEDEITFENEQWVKYAISNSVISVNEITAQNSDEYATYMNMLQYFTKAKQEIREESISPVEVNFSNYGDFSNIQQLAIKDAINNGVIKNSNSKFDGDKKINKGSLNKLIIDYVESASILAPKGQTIRQEEFDMPKNEKEYPYILEDISNEVYEMEKYKFDETSYKNSIELYDSFKDYYIAVQRKVENYYNTVLNVDYQTITVDTFKEGIYADITEFEDGTKDVDIPELSSEDLVQIEKYVEYVKNNKIKITGTAKVQMPIIYFDGRVYRARTKLEYNIENTDTLNNILFLDLENGDNTYSYNRGQNTEYIDVPFTKTFGDLYLEFTQIKKCVVGNIQEDLEYVNEEI